MDRRSIRLGGIQSALSSGEILHKSVFVVERLWHRTPSDISNPRIAGMMQTLLGD